MADRWQVSSGAQAAKASQERPIRPAGFWGALFVLCTSGAQPHQGVDASPHIWCFGGIMSLEDVPRNYPHPRFQAEKYLPALAGKLPPPSCFRFCPGGGEWQKAALVKASVPSSSPSPTPVVLSSPTLPPVCRVLSWLACSSKAVGAFFAQHRPSEPSPTKAARPAPWPVEWASTEKIKFT